MDIDKNRGAGPEFINNPQRNRPANAAVLFKYWRCFRFRWNWRSRGFGWKGLRRRTQIQGLSSAASYELSTALSCGNLLNRQRYFFGTITPQKRRPNLGRRPEGCAEEHPESLHKGRGLREIWESRSLQRGVLTRSPPRGARVQLSRSNVCCSGPCSLFGLLQLPRNVELSLSL